MSSLRGGEGDRRGGRTLPACPHAIASSPSRRPPAPSAAPRSPRARAGGTPTLRPTPRPPPAPTRFLRPPAAPGPPARAPGAGPARFLQPPGDAGPPPPGGAANGADAAPGAASAAAADCRKDPKTAGTTPTGWCIRPAGTNIDVLRFPLGLTPAAGGSKIVVTSNSGGAQGLTVIDAASLTAVPTTQGNLFMGVAPTPDGRVYASGGNADRVFRFHFAGTSLVSDDPTEQGTFPVHNGIDGGLLSRAGQDNAPAGNSIAVPGYPGPITRFGKYALVADTLSEPSEKAHPCPSRQAA